MLRRKRLPALRALLFLSLIQTVVPIAVCSSADLRKLSAQQKSKTGERESQEFRWRQLTDNSPDKTIGLS